MTKSFLPFRQVHLDFHTSPHIPEVAHEFDAEVFAATLEKARVNSVTCFARCHHGLIYYDSKRYSERIHPHLVQKDLLAKQIGACHQRGIRVPIYTTIQWDDYTADEHRDWLLIDERGAGFSTPPLQPGFYRFLDVYHPGYRKFLEEHVKEILERLPVDGFFFDIVQPRWSLAKHWLDGMDNEGYNPEDEGSRRQFAVKVIDDWKREMSDFVRGLKPDCSLFYNAGHVGPRHRSTREAYTHYELESLPSGGWGYLHFPLSVRYARTFGHDYLGMTGKFHTSWGDFHSFKNEAALEFECFSMLAHGAKCSVGDQLHPSGKLDGYSYELIGNVYREVEAKEPWCQESTVVTEIAVLTPEEFFGYEGGINAQAERTLPSASGAVRLLQELRLQFSLIDSLQDLSAYRLLVLPDDIPVSEALARKIKHYLADGGALLASYRSGLTPEGTGFSLDDLGVQLVGKAPYSPDFIVPRNDLSKDLSASGYVMYLPGLEVEALAGADVLAQVEAPYFNRTWRHYCSHRHTPSSGRLASYPAVVKNNRCVYFMHPVFRQYHDNAPRWCKRLIRNAIDLLLPDKLVEVQGPSSLQVTLNKQGAERRYILHLLHYIPERRGQAFDVLEDVIPVHNVPVSVKVPEEVVEVRAVPGGASVPFHQENDRISFTVAEVKGHQMVELRFT